MADAKSDFERYVERYSVKHGLTKEQAEEHKVVQDVKEYYEEKESGKDGK